MTLSGCARFLALFAMSGRFGARNPVTRGLVKTREAWAWSNFRHSATGMKGTVKIESQWTAFGRASQLPDGVQFTDLPGMINEIDPLKALGL